MAPVATRAEHSTHPREQWWVRRDWTPTREQLAQARAWLAEGRPLPMHWYGWLANDVRARRPA